MINSFIVKSEAKDLVKQFKKEVKFIKTIKAK